MNLKALIYQILHGSIARRLLVRSFAIASAISIFPLLQVLFRSNSIIFSPYDCVGDLPDLLPNAFPGSELFRSGLLPPLWSSIELVHCDNYVNSTNAVVAELMDKNLMDYSAKSLCAGEGSTVCVRTLHELGFPSPCGAEQHRFFSLKQKKFVYEINYKDKTFDFVMSRDIDKVSVPALLVLEIERVLKPGGIGAMLVSSIPDSLVRSATPVSSLLKTSDVVHVGFIDNSTLVVFKKRFENIRFLDQIKLPDNCPSVTNNRAFIDFMEPLKKEHNFSYLPNFLDVSSRKRFVYIDIGAGEHLSSSADWFLPLYPVDSKAFRVYFVDHNTSVLMSYVTRPGVTFVYHPGLAQNKGTNNVDHDFDIYPPGIGGFDFLGWFKETVRNADFVVLKMNTGEEAEVKFLVELFESGAICFVDELFLHCSEAKDGDGPMNGDCVDMIGGLRSIGVFVHRWFGH